MGAGTYVDLRMILLLGMKTILTFIVEADISVILRANLFGFS